MKSCIRCLEMKPLAEFYRHKAMSDGHLNKCKSCCRADSKANRKNNVEYYRAYDRARGSRQSAEHRRRYIRENPIKYAAQTMVGNAVRDGRLRKPDTCENCGTGGRIHGHHDDYAQPLQVRWLCAACHHQWHAVHGEGLNAR